MEQNEIQEIINSIKPYLKNTILDIQRVSGGLVHYVYKVTTNHEVVYIKKRTTHYSGLPHISTDPNLIKYEKEALKIVARIAPSVFPQVLEYVPDSNMLILSDIMPSKKTLEQELDSLHITETDTFNLGLTLADIHQKLSEININIREDKEEEFYNQLLYYKLGFHNLTAINETIDILKASPKQLVLGDLSPKNIGFSTVRTYTICDLENFHNGNTLTDVGLLGCSLILHTMKDSSLAYKLFLSFLKGYKSLVDIDIDDINLKRIVLGIALYRLANPVIPYTLPITESQKKAKVQAIQKILTQKNISWKVIVNIITRENEN